MNTYLGWYIFASVGLPESRSSCIRNSIQIYKTYSHDIAIIPKSTNQPLKSFLAILRSIIGIDPRVADASPRPRDHIGLDSKPLHRPRMEVRMYTWESLYHVLRIWPGYPVLCYIRSLLESMLWYRLRHIGKIQLHVSILRRPSEPPTSDTTTNLQPYNSGLLAVILLPVRPLRHGDLFQAKWNLDDHDNYRPSGFPSLCDQR